ncbi:unnamed protein product, partial [Urochloa humidicola]
DTPDSRPARKRLAYNIVEDEEESDDVHFKRSKDDKVTAPIDPTANTSTDGSASKRLSPERSKTTIQRTGESRTHRSQKTK